MSKHNLAPANSTGQPSTVWRWLLSALIVFHFFGLGLTYAANWRRSQLQDDILTNLQPYLIAGDWYHEMLPVEWYSDSSRSQLTWIAVQESDSGPWQRILDNQTRSLDLAQRSRLLRLMIELADNTDSDGLSRIMKAMVVHHEQLDPKVKIARIRLERETSEDENGVSPMLFEATVARFEDGGIGIVPKIESRRAVRATNLQRGTP